MLRSMNRCWTGPTIGSLDAPMRKSSEVLTKSNILRFLILLPAVAPSSFSQTYTIQTFAGRGWDLQGVTANLSSIRGIAVDDAGNAYMALSEYSAVVRMDPGGALTLVPGDGTHSGGGDESCYQRPAQ